MHVLFRQQAVIHFGNSYWQNMATGNIEVLVNKFTVLNECKELPFDVKDHMKVGYE